MDRNVQLRAIEWASMLLVVIGAVNWGLVGLGGFVGSNFNLVNLVFGSIPAVESLVYVLVGLAGLYMAYVGYRLYGAQTDASTTAAASRKSTR